MRELAATLPRTVAALPGRLASIRIAPPPITPRTRRHLAIAAIAAVVLGALYHLWLRDSSLVAVSDVHVSGLSTKDGPRIRATLAAAAEDMTTLHIRVDELEDIARQFPVVNSIEVERDFPHGLRIAVTERRAVAQVSVEDVPVPVAADGTLLSGLQAPEGLPLLRMEKPVSDGRVADERVLRALVVAGAAPPEFTQKIARVSEGPEYGVAIELRDGPEIYFGDADRADAKWTAATRVLADPSARGATYVDVRLPERPVAGGLAAETIEPVAPAGETIVPPAGTVAPEDPMAAPVPAEPAPAAPETAAPAPAPPPTTAVPTEPQP